MTLGVLILGHGSRDSAANWELEGLVDAYRASHPELEVAHGYVELAEPALAQALRSLAARCERVVVVPLFLFAAGHVKNDLPLALASMRAELPGTDFVAARALGVHADLVALARERADGVLSAGFAWRAAPSADALASEQAKSALVIVGRGSSDPDANGDFCKTARLIAEGGKYAAALPCFMGICSPLVPDALELAARTRPTRLVVLPYLLFAGRLISKLQQQLEAFSQRYPWIFAELAPHLGGDPRMLALIDQRVHEALNGSRPLPCDTCQYRVPVAGVAQHVGGLQALLWSARHGYTHTQAMPHLHAHRALLKHVLVCGNVDCAERGSVALISALRRCLRGAGRERDIRVTRTHCMGRCGEGPTLAVYPDGIWYRGVQAHDAEELVKEHLLGDRLVGRLVDNIMQ